MAHTGARSRLLPAQRCAIVRASTIEIYLRDLACMKTFRIAINMAGAISAGAYTAGVLDFLTEALDAWYEAKSRKELVPNHDVCIEIFSGASAGGMCAAISAILLQDDFEHISDTSQ